jgi:hypothetical protein
MNACVRRAGKGAQGKVIVAHADIRARRAHASGRALCMAIPRGHGAALSMGHRRNVWFAPLPTLRRADEVIA